jgi:hypothetical protein
MLLQLLQNKAALDTATRAMVMTTRHPQQNNQQKPYFKKALEYSSAFFYHSQ